MEKIRALVTGASKGIGKATAERLLSEGYDVFSPSHSELDLSDEGSVRDFCGKHSDEYFGVIVNNAGINEINRIEDITDEEIYRTVNINLVSPMKLLRSFVPAMKAHRYGRIVNIGSIWGVVSKGGRTVYSATKHGIHGVTKTLAVELARDNILVNTVSPGFTMTELTRKNNTPAQIEEIGSEIPIGRLAQPDEIAGVVCWLAGSGNTYLTGQMITVDGGFTSK